MSIRTLTSHTEADRTISLVEVSKGKIERRSWEFTCDKCGDHCTNLTEAEARDEMLVHKCEHPFWWESEECGPRSRWTRD